MGGQAPHVAQIGSASGAEERHTSHRLPQGYAYMIDSPEAITPLFHFINTKDPSRADINSAGDPRVQAPAVPLREPVLECHGWDRRRMGALPSLWDLLTRLLRRGEPIL